MEENYQTGWAIKEMTRRLERMLGRIQIKKLTDKAILPTQGTPSSAGYDLYYAGEDGCVVIEPHSTKKIGTGIAISIPEGYFGGIYARSGMALKKGLRPANCTGVIDADYRGEVIVALHNDGDSLQAIKPGERIAQLIIQKSLPIEWDEVDELDDTTRGDGGFGSTGN